MSAVFRYIFVLYSLAVLILPCSAQELVIISPHWEGIRYEYENGFNRWRKQLNQTEVKFIWKQVGGTSEILRYVQSEFQVKKNNPDQGIGIDMIFGGGSDPYELLKKENLLKPYTPQALSELPKQVSGVNLYDPDLYWFAPTISAFGIFCNHKVLNSLGLRTPQSWEDLVKPEFKSWIATADPRKSGSAHMYYEIILQSYGWERGWQILFDMSDNFRTFLSASSQVGLDVASGEVACGFYLDSQAKVQMLKYPLGQFSFSVPKGKSLFSGDAMAILKGSKNYEIAGQFLDYMLSIQAQKLWYLPVGANEGPLKYTLNKLPIYPELFNDPSISEYNPFVASENNSQFIFSNKQSSERWEVLNDLLGIFLIENFDYGTLKNQNCRNNLPAETEINQIVSTKDWSDPVKKNRIISKWRSAMSGCIPTKSSAHFPFFCVLGILIAFAIKKKIK